MLDLEKNLSLTWDGSKKLGRVGHRPKKEFPDEKALRGRFALGLRKKSKATVYRSENIGAGKQSAGRRVGKNFPSPMESFPWQGCVFFGGVFFSAEKIKVPDEKIFHGISVAGLRKNFGRDSASEWRHGTAQKNLAGSAIGLGHEPKTTGPKNAIRRPPGRQKLSFPDEKVLHGISVAGLRKNFGRDSASEWRHGAARKNLAGSAIGRGRRTTREILGLKKKVACRVWLVRCSLYVGEGASVPFSELAVTVHRP